ncbi:response regulator [Paenibacillus sp. HJGM_3]|uniref:response regulator transcription factor n=1 Tax=Paenibacillus sp. HJGM_3 TaxID=3379816 RepID=UPI00385AD5AC
MRTYRCLIVDDEDLILQRLEQVFEEEANRDARFQLVGKAYGGQEGLELADGLQPDIVITDIVMPGMDGLEMIETLKKRRPKTVFIVLSAYSDFHYAKRAIQSDVTEYIVKVPLNEADLRNALLKAADRLEQAERNETEVLQLNRSMLEIRHRVRKQFFSDLFRGAVPSPNLAEFAHRFSLKLNPDSYCCFVAEMNDYNPFTAEYDSADQSVLKYGLCNILEETVGEFGMGFASELEESRFIGYVSLPDVRSASEWERQCQELGRRMIANVRHYLKRHVSVGFSEPAQGFGAMIGAYAKARSSCDDAFYWGTGSVVTPAHREVYREEHADAVQSVFQELLPKLEPDMSALALADSISMLQNRAIDLKLKREPMTTAVRGLLEEAKGKIRSWKPSLPPLGERNMAYMSFREQMDFVREHLLECLKERNPYVRQEIVKARQYIERHLAGRLSLQEVADCVNLAPAYFSSLFKKEMSESMVEYVNRRKIEKSLELLQVRDYSNQELCDAVGIVSEAYFCTLFKQITGYSPKQYRKRVRQA